MNQTGSSDGDARYGRFPDGTLQPGYKQQTVVDGEHRVVVGLEVFPANRAEGVDAVGIVEQVREEVGLRPEVICADGAYGSGANRAAFEERGMRLVSPPQPVPHQGGECFTVDRFIYNESCDEFECPGGKRLGYAGRTGRKGRQRKYRCKHKVCRSCALRSQCTPGAVRCVTVSKDHAALIRLRADSKTDDFQQLYRGRAPAIEGVFAEAKERHGLRRAWRRGLSKMRIQCLLIAAVINFKRLITLFLPQNGLPGAIWTAIATLGRILTAIAQLETTPISFHEHHRRITPIPA